MFLKVISAIIALKEIIYALIAAFKTWSSHSKQKSEEKAKEDIEKTVDVVVNQPVVKGKLRSTKPLEDLLSGKKD